MKLYYLYHPLAYIAIAIACCIPFFCLYLHVQEKLDVVENLEKEMRILSSREVYAGRINEQGEILSKQLNRADHFYLDKNIETLSFLGQKLGSLRSFSSEILDNRLLFAEEKITKDDYLIEVEEKQQHPVALNMEDLKRLLSSIEGVTIGGFTPKNGRPQLIVRDFYLKKVPASSEEDLFIIDMKLIKREKYAS